MFIVPDRFTRCFPGASGVQHLHPLLPRARSQGLAPSSQAVVYRRGKDGFSPNSYLLLPLSPARLSESQTRDSRSGCSNQQPLDEELFPGEPPRSDFKGQGAAPGRGGEEKRCLTLLAPGSKCNLTYGSAKPLWSIGFRPWRRNGKKQELGQGQDAGQAG